jgi:hypothetical protein
MNFDLSKDELALLEELLSKEFDDLSVEMHHCKTNKFKKFLKEKRTLVEELLDRVKKAQ